MENEPRGLFDADPVDGVGAYGISKIAGEEVCAEFRRQGMCVPVIRPKTFIGTARLGVFQILYDWVDSGKVSRIDANKDSNLVSICLS